MIVTIVHFKSGLSEQEVLDISEARAPQYRAREGLIQKYYLRYPATGEYGAVYIWESEEALEAFRQSALMGSIAASYEVEGAPDFELAEVLLLLRPGTEGTQHTLALASEPVLEAL